MIRSLSSRPRSGRITAVLLGILLYTLLLTGCSRAQSEDEQIPLATAALAATAEEVSVIAETETPTPLPTDTPTATATATQPATTPTPSPEVTAESTRTVTPRANTATLTPTAPIATATAASPTVNLASIPGMTDGNWQLADVIHVVDGDTIDVQIDSQTYRVRYIGMDTPERNQPYFNEATQANRHLVDGQTVILVKDVSEVDRYNRLLRYVFLQDGTFVNAELVRLGYALIATFPPDVEHQELFLQMQQEARESGRGLWGLPTLTSVPAPQPTFTRVPTARPTSSPQPTAHPSGAITLVSLTSPTSPGQDATLTIRVAPGAVCDPGVIYRSGESSAQGLGPKTAGTGGQLWWTWRVGSNTTPGTWTVYVVCDPGGRREWPFVVQ